MSVTLDRPRTQPKLPSRERAVVEELREVFRKHQHQAPANLARLVGLAFETSLGPAANREDKLARAHVRGLAARQQVAEAEGGSWSSDEVARLLNISKTAVLKRLAAGRLLAWREERLQAARFPRWQFDAHGQVLAGLEEVLEILNRDQRLDVWARLLFFLQVRRSSEDRQKEEEPRPDIQARLLFFLQVRRSSEDRRPLDLLRDGRVREAVLAAQAYAE